MLLDAATISSAFLRTRLMCASPGDSSSSALGIRPVALFGVATVTFISPSRAKESYDPSPSGHAAAQSPHELAHSWRSQAGRRPPPLRVGAYSPVMNLRCLLRIALFCSHARWLPIVSDNIWSNLSGFSTSGAISTMPIRRYPTRIRTRNSIHGANHMSK